MLTLSSELTRHQLAQLTLTLPCFQALHNAVEDGKEPYGPACRDYFWLLCRLVDSLPEDLIKGMKS